MRLALVTAMLFGAVITSSPAANADCPTAVTASRGFKLEAHDPRMADHDIQPFDSETVRIFTSNPRNPSFVSEELTTWRGILQQKLSGRVAFELELDGDFRSLHPVKGGATLATSYTVKVGDKVRKAKLKVRVDNEPTELTIGACTYQVWKIIRHSEFEDGERSVFHDYYAPDLSMWLRREVAVARPGQDLVLLIFAFKSITGR
ncbi:MAG TPA: hypothetical protein PK264_01230 [Hyphomicrobiaceae bacterium]|nr:hypothetical protein [Hyphomicrobiaceae bacterium]